MELTIELWNPNRSYFAGQVVEGRVLIRTTKLVRHNEITILLKGTAVIHWAKDRHEQENLINQTISFVGIGQSLKDESSGGFSSYPFRFELSPCLPSSFNSSGGNISYVLKAEVKQSLSRIAKAKLPFTVNGVYDLNLKPEARHPQSCRERVTPNSLVGRFRTLDFHFSLLNRSGFVPGDCISFRVDVTNNSNKKLVSVKVSLIQIIKFYYKGKEVNKNKKKICDTKESPEGPVWEGNLQIPGAPPTGLGEGGLCHIIDVQYCLRFKMTISGWSSSVVKKLPVWIGTLALTVS